MAPDLEVEENEEPESSQERDAVDSVESDIIEPANIGVERCFVVMKFYEERFKGMTF